MNRSVFSKRGLWRFCIVVLIAAAGVSCCNRDHCETTDPVVVADHWLVIHDKAGTLGAPWTDCIADPPEDNIAFLPGCLDVEEGDTIGFANYSDVGVTVSHFMTVDAPDDPIALASGEKKVFTVVVEGQRLTLDIESTSPFDHGGPEMIIRP